MFAWSGLAALGTSADSTAAHLCFVCRTTTPFLPPCSAGRDERVLHAHRAAGAQRGGSGLAPPLHAHGPHRPAAQSLAPPQGGVAPVVWDGQTASVQAACSILLLLKALPTTASACPALPCSVCPEPSPTRCQPWLLKPLARPLTTRARTHAAGRGPEDNRGDPSGGGAQAVTICHAGPAAVWARLSTRRPSRRPARAVSARPQLGLGLLCSANGNSGSCLGLTCCCTSHSVSVTGPGDALDTTRLLTVELLTPAGGLHLTIGWTARSAQ